MGFPLTNPVMCGDSGWFQMEKLNQSVHCSQGFPQTVITSDYFQRVGFGSKKPVYTVALVFGVCCTEDIWLYHI